MSPFGQPKQSSNDTGLIDMDMLLMDDDPLFGGIGHEKNGEHSMDDDVIKHVYSNCYDKISGIFVAFTNKIDEDPPSSMLPSTINK